MRLNETLIDKIKSAIDRNRAGYNVLVISLLLAFIFGLVIPLLRLIQLAILFCIAISIIWISFHPKSFFMVVIVLFPILMGINFQSPINGIRFGLDVLVSLIIIMKAIILFIAQKQTRFDKTIIFFSIYVMIMLLSTLQSLDVINSISFIIRQISYIALIFLLQIYFTEDKDILTLFVAIILASVFPIIQSLYGLFTQLESLQVIGHNVTYRAGFFSEAGGPYALSAFLLSPIAVTLSIFSFLISRKNFKLAIISLLYLFVLILGILSTFYRSSWIAVTIIILIASRNKKYILIPFTIFIILVLICIPAVTERVWQAFDPTSSIYGRINQWGWTLIQFYNHPSKLLTGFGRGSYPLLVQRDATSYLQVDSPHNYYLSVLFDNGIFGLLIFILLLLHIMIKAKNMRIENNPIDALAREAILLIWIGFITMSITTSPFGNPAAAFYFWVIVSMGIADKNSSNKLNLINNE